jgi:hypothetical protein
MIEAVRCGLPEGHHCYVDEQGLLDDPRHFFMFDGGHQPLAGNGVILAETDAGDEAPCSLALDGLSTASGLTSQRSSTYLHRSTIRQRPTWSAAGSRPASTIAFRLAI